MNKFTTLSLAALFVAGTGLAAMAQQGTDKPGAENPGTTGGAYQGGTAPAQPGAAGMHEHMGSAGMHGQEQGEHQMSGTILKIDHKKGGVTLKTDVTKLQLHFPPQAIQSLKKGDRITAQLAFVKGTQPEQSSRAYDARRTEQGATGERAEPGMAGKHDGMGQHWMTGKISRINHDKGLVTVKAEDHTLKLHFPPQSLGSLKDGDQISVKQSFTKANM